jgi:hypothetical protein
VRQVTPALHEEAPAIEQRSKQVIGGLEILSPRVRREVGLRQSGALSEPEYERLKGVLLAAADGGMTPVAPRIYTDSS